MKHRSVSKVRSTKNSKKIRSIKNQGSGKVPTKHIRRLVWCSNIFNPSRTDAQTGASIPAFISVGHGTYCRAKHDIVDDKGIVIKRYVPTR